MTLDGMLLGLATFVLLGMLVLMYRQLRQTKKELKDTQDESATLEARYAPLIKLDKEIEQRQSDLQVLTEKYDNLKPLFEQKHKDLSHDYGEQMKLYYRLKAEVDKLYGNIDSISFGFYEPYFDYGTPEAFKAAIRDVRDKQKQLAKDDRAAPCNTTWHVEGSKTEGNKMVKRQSKLMLRAFNGECDAAIAKVKWDNVRAIEERLKKSWESVNKSGGSMQIAITHEYLDLKLKELHLTHELAEKRQEVKEEQARIREEMREEEMARREIEKAQEDADKEEKRYEEALRKAREELEAAHGEATEARLKQIEELEAQLADAHAKSERATSRAQETKSGHVYIISNIGSFGKHVYKIGMTRRLEPLDRVKELGDASVPFRFDVHGMIYTNDAPALERQLHDHFNERRINLVNFRKEFFKVSLAEIQQVITGKELEIELTKVVEAQEFRETLALRRDRLTKKEQQEKLEQQELPEGLPVAL